MLKQTWLHLRDTWIFNKVVPIFGCLSKRWRVPEILEKEVFLFFNPGSLFLHYLQQLFIKASYVSNATVVEEELISCRLTFLKPVLCDLWIKMQLLILWPSFWMLDYFNPEASSNCSPQLTILRFIHCSLWLKSLNSYTWKEPELYH